jgi:ribonuclease HII
MSSHNSSGSQAEDKVADYLEQAKYKILDRNWKTRWCEIDIVAEKSSRVHFVEVKYRKNESQGSGLDYITASKLRQMRFAAEMWISNHKEYSEYVLSAAEVSGPHFKIEFIEQI